MRLQQCGNDLMPSIEFGKQLFQSGDDGEIMMMLTVMIMLMMIVVIMILVLKLLNSVCFVTFIIRTFLRSQSYFYQTNFHS